MCSGYIANLVALADEDLVSFVIMRSLSHAYKSELRSLSNGLSFSSAVMWLIVLSLSHSLNRDLVSFVMSSFSHAIENVYLSLHNDKTIPHTIIITR